MKLLHKAITILALTLGMITFGHSFAAEGTAGAAAKDLVLKGDAKCTRCHDESDSPGVLAIGKTRHGTVADGRTPTCTSCHGESDLHVNNSSGKQRPGPDRTFTKSSTTPVEARNGACLTCHEKDAKRSHWAGSVHQPSGILPQLLNSIEEKQVLDLIQDDSHCAQEKFDGRRLIIRKEGAQINGINKKGNLVGLPEPLFQVIYQYDGDVVIDGESIGDNYHAFDLLVLDGVDIRNWPYRERLAALMNLLFGIQQTVVKFATTAFTTEQKLALLNNLKKGRKEGIVFKQLHSAYTTGRPNSGGSHLKHKFVATLSAVVARVNRQRSVALQLLGQDGWEACGNVTIPANHKIPQPGQTVEIRYLYGFKESGVLYQPVYLGPRDDVDDSECLTSQIKYKADTLED